MEQLFIKQVEPQFQKRRQQRTDIFQTPCQSSEDAHTILHDIEFTPGKLRPKKRKEAWQQALQNVKRAIFPSPSQLFQIRLVHVMTKVENCVEDVRILRDLQNKEKNLRLVYHTFPQKTWPFDIIEAFNPPVNFALSLNQNSRNAANTRCL